MLTFDTTRPSAWAKSLVIGSALAISGMLAGPASAQTDFSAIESDPALWVLQDEDSTVYLFGSFHILPGSLNWRTPEIDAALAASDTVYFEADVLSPEAQAEAQALIPVLGMNEAGVTLSGLISDEAKADLAQFAERLGAPPEMLAQQLDPLKPWLAQLSIAVVAIQAQGYDPNSGVERIIHQDAEAAGKSFGYFETIEEQLGFFANLPLEVQIADFEVGLADLVDNPEEINDLLVAWATGDMERVDQMMNESLRASSDHLYEALIVERNQNWIPQIEAILAGSGTSFVAVGAGHMPGELGVISLLQAQGHSVVRQ